MRRGGGILKKKVNDSECDGNFGWEWIRGKNLELKKNMIAGWKCIVNSKGGGR